MPLLGPSLPMVQTVFGQHITIEVWGLGAQFMGLASGSVMGVGFKFSRFILPIIIIRFSRSCGSDWSLLGFAGRFVFRDKAP